MADVQRVIDEARPMLEEFLAAAGLHHPGRPLALRGLLDPFDRWLAAQEVAEEDRVYLAVRLAAFVCEYLIEVAGGERVVRGGRILMRVPVGEGGVAREFDLYAAAGELAAGRGRLGAFLAGLCVRG